MAAKTWATDAMTAESSAVPVALDEVFARLDNCLRRDHARALIAVVIPGNGPLATVERTIFEAELKQNGRVFRCDLVSRARKLGLLENFETALDHWRG
jgi:hypothetical protein